MIRDLLCWLRGHMKHAPMVPVWVDGWQPCRRCGRWYRDEAEAKAGRVLP